MSKKHSKKLNKTQSRLARNAALTANKPTTPTTAPSVPRRQYGGNMQHRPQKTRAELDLYIRSLEQQIAMLAANLNASRKQAETNYQRGFEAAQKKLETPAKTRLVLVEETIQ